MTKSYSSKIKLPIVKRPFFGSDDKPKAAFTLPECNKLLG
ncbi:hypothetical protein CPS_0242 [Colwellia psychrerythraea 34H]|uniref:Uncharacterized protein n=1 Tax=Colwellia psychrerythraea (strain 34H / ATCC BAA-681) TaxID=167879 RepID=Q48AA4_COLP3|nr:hypothetical protein CPS_0242 [Colwellia psychrerythraea 34H]